MAVLETGKETPTARMLSQEEIATHESQVDSVMEYLGQYPEVLEKREQSAPDVPTLVEPERSPIGSRIIS